MSQVSRDEDDAAYEYVWHIRYERPDGSFEQRPEEDPKRSVKLIAGGGAAFLVLGAGVGAMLGLRFGSGPDKQVAVPRSGVHVAAKALLYGTVLAWAGTGALVYGVARYLDVHSFKEFGDKMRERVPHQSAAMTPRVQAVRDWLQDKVGPYVPKRGSPPDNVENKQ